MKTIHKLVLKSYIGPLVMTFFIIMFILLMNILWRYIDELVGKGLGLDVILELLGYALITMLPMGLPLVMLLSAIMTMGNLGENYELLAMKSAGMSLPKIMQPLIILTLIVAVASFFLINNLVPYSYQQMYSLRYDIKKQKQTLEFQDGLFFTGIDDMSIRVDHQDPETGLLHNVLIYDNRSQDGNMTTTMADSGYIRLSDDKQFLRVTLYQGETYDQSRNAQRWYTESALSRHIFDIQKLNIPMEGFDMSRTDAEEFNNEQTKNIHELEGEIARLDEAVNSNTTRSYEPLLKEQLFVKDNTVLALPDSLMYSKEGFRPSLVADSIALMDTRAKEQLWDDARSAAKNSRNMFTFDESAAKDSLNKLYRSKVEWHRKISLPVSILIFFLIGAPLGAIIRKGGLGMPIVISVIFFVIYYIISLMGEKMAKEGTWEAIYGMWLSAFILTPIAIYLTYQATNDSGLLDWDWYIGKWKAFKERRKDKKAAKLQAQSEK